MKTLIIGWYGTETIGDRAILAGLVSILGELGCREIIIGSLNVVLTERTLIEDISFLEKCSNAKIKFSIVETINPFALRKAVITSDLLLMGGGPLMDLAQISMIDYAFRLAKKHSVNSIVAGCGWGPLTQESSIKLATNIINNASATIMRDGTSVEAFHKYSDKPILSSIDPAFFACQKFLELNPATDIVDKKYCAVNFRKISENNLSFMPIIDQVLEYTDSVKLIPMHTFFCGGDDRYGLNELALKLNHKNVEVQNQPISLYDTMEIYRRAEFCVGMRFHSVVLQTALNGKNIVLDYTDPEQGKTIGLLRELNFTESIKERYFSVYNYFNTNKLAFKNPQKTLQPTSQFIKDKFNIYKDTIRMVLT